MAKAHRKARLAAHAASSVRRGGRSLKFLTSDAEAVTRRLFESKSSPENLRGLFEEYFLRLQNLLPPPEAGFDGLPRAVGLVLSKATLKRLRADKPGHAKSGDVALMRYYSSDTAAIANQALCHLVDVVLGDLLAYPGQPLNHRGGRIVERLMKLPSLSGRRAESQLLRGYQHVWAYELAKSKLPKRRNDCYRIDEIQRVLDLLASTFAGGSENKGLSDAEGNRLTQLPRNRIALELAARVVRPPLRPESIRKLRSSARRVDRELDRAIRTIPPP